MSFSNDEDGDGLAALFGGITPQGAPGEQPGPRRAAAANPEPAAPSAPPASPPPASTAPAYAPPGTPAYEMPAPAPQAPRAYDLPAPAAAPSSAPPVYGAPATPQYPGLAPTPSYPAPPAPATTPYAPPAPQAGGAAPGGTASPAATPPAPASPAPAYPATAQYPTGIDPATFAAPAGPAFGAATPVPPASVPAASQPPTSGPPATPLPPAAVPAASQPPTSGPPATSAAPPTYSAPPAYVPPTYETPTYVPPVSPSPAAYDPPAAAAPASAPAYEPPPVVEPVVAEFHPAPEPVVEPPAFNGFEALGLQPGAPGVFGESDPAPATAFPGVPPSASQAPSAAERVAPANPYGEHPIVRADASSVAAVAPAGPLLPAAGAVVEDADELARPTVLEKVGLGAAVLTGPVGLLLAIVNAARGVRRRGWVIGLVRVSIVLAVLSTIGFAIGGYALWNLRLEQLRHDQVAAASAEFCAAGAADPALVSPPTLGWPREGETITDSLALMQAWTDNWRALAATSPAGLRSGLELLAQRGDVIIDAVTSSRSIDDDANKEQISSIEGQSGVANWYATYCAEP